MSANDFATELLARSRDFVGPTIFENVLKELPQAFDWHADLTAQRLDQIAADCRAGAIYIHNGLCRFHSFFGILTPAQIVKIAKMMINNKRAGEERACAECGKTDPFRNGNQL